MNLKNLEKLALSALESAYYVHQKLGSAGETLIQKNRFDETALKMDIDAEKAIIDIFRQSGVPIKIISEEHGIVELGKSPIYLGILDGLDGSSVYKKARGKGRYGTMLGIFSNLNPNYEDYLFSGVMEHSTNRLFYSTKGAGSRVIVDGKSEYIYCSKTTKLAEDIKIYVDEYFDINRNTFSLKLSGFDVKYLGSSAVYYVDLASGDADLVLECTRKGNLEIAIAYGLETESGGCMITLDGQDIGSQKYLEFGQDKHIPIISASTKELAEQLIHYIS